MMTVEILVQLSLYHPRLKLLRADCRDPIRGGLLPINRDPLTTKKKAGLFRLEERGFWILRGGLSLWLFRLRRSSPSSQILALSNLVTKRACNPLTLSPH